MNRLHKYRYWYSGKMVDVGSIEFFENGTYRVNDELIGGVLLEFTGLKDKNGKEIYEGDICEVITADGSEKGKIIFNFGCFFFNCEGDKMHLLEHQTHKMLEVIGNIYENPELLKP